MSPNMLSPESEVCRKPVGCQGQVYSAISCNFYDILGIYVIMYNIHDLQHQETGTTQLGVEFRIAALIPMGNGNVISCETGFVQS